MSTSIFHPKVALGASILAGVLLIAGVTLRWTHTLPQAVSPLLYLSLAIGLFYGGRAAIEAIRELKFDIDVLMVIGAVLAAAIGHPEEGALLLVLFTFSGALEEIAMERTGRAVEALVALMPAEAIVFRNDAWVEAAADSLVTNDRIKIRPGERVPADSTVLVGETAFDQSAITGESMPRTVKPGDDLFAGTINTDNPIEARVLRPVKESALQRIVNLATSARSQRAPVQGLLDKIDQPYSIGVAVVSIIVFFVFWKALDRDPKESLYTAITLLIVASPCALIIATPVATLSSINRAARGGVLLKGGAAITRLASIACIGLDKTGTLTLGRPRLYEVHPIGQAPKDHLLALAAGLEADSTHPIAQAIRDGAAAKSIAPAVFTKVDNVIAQGLSGTTSDGCTVRLGRFSYVEPLIPEADRQQVRTILDQMQGRGHIAVTVARTTSADGSGGEAGVIIMADAVRPGAQQLVEQLHALNIKPVRMLTGDNAATAKRVSDSLKLDGFNADLLPGDKLRIVHEMKQHGPVAILGDGVNDAPALAAADASIAIGTIGTAAAMESADAVLLTESLATVPWVVGLARRTQSIVKFNIALALTLLAVMAVCTVVGAIIKRPVPLSIGVTTHEGGTLLVVLNSLRLLAHRSGTETQPKNPKTPKNQSRP